MRTLELAFRKPMSQFFISKSPDNSILSKRFDRFVSCSFRAISCPGIVFKFAAGRRASCYCTASNRSVTHCFHKCERKKTFAPHFNPILRRRVFFATRTNILAFCFKRIYRPLSAPKSSVRRTVTAVREEFGAIKLR